MYSEERRKKQRKNADKNNSHTHKKRTKYEQFWNEMRNDIFLCHFFWLFDMMVISFQRYDLKTKENLQLHRKWTFMPDSINYY